VIFLVYFVKSWTKFKIFQKNIQDSFEESEFAGRICKTLIIKCKKLKGKIRKIITFVKDVRNF